MALSVIRYMSVTNVTECKVLVEYIVDKEDMVYAKEVFYVVIQFYVITHNILNEQNSSPNTSLEYMFGSKYGNGYVLKDGNNFVFLCNFSINIGLLNNNVKGANGFLITEELRQQFFEVYPEVIKNSSATLSFNKNNHYLYELCKKYGVENTDNSMLIENETKVYLILNIGT